MNDQIGLKNGFEERLDVVAKNVINNEKCPIPGIVVLAKWGKHSYHKAFGFSDMEQNIPMKLDSQFRCFSMTKVFASTIALILKDEGLIDLEATVGSYIPSFDKNFEVIINSANCENEVMEIPYTSFMTGKTKNLSYCKKVAKNKMLVKHCLAESAGVGYDMWTDFDLAFQQPIFGHQYGVAQALRKKNGIGYYTSNTIIGQNATLEEYCNAIAAAGYLVAEPGTFSYGLGALILGRIIEVVLEKETGKFLRFSEICNEKLFKPLRMNSAAFFLDDGDPRISKVPQLYGAVLNDETQKLEVKPYSNCLPKLSSLPNTVTTDQYQGVRKCDSGDTGSCMIVSDYAKFYEMLLSGGYSEDGKRILTPKSVKELTHGEFLDLDRHSKLAQAFGLTGETASFNYGWALEKKTSTTPHCNQWSGYANNHGRLYVEDDAYILIFPQFMASTPAGFPIGDPVIKEPLVEAFLSEWI